MPLTFNTRMRCRSPRYFFSKRYKSFISCVFSCSICAVVISTSTFILNSFLFSLDRRLTSLTFQSLHPLPPLCRLLCQAGGGLDSLAGLLGLLHDRAGPHHVRGHRLLLLLPRDVHQCPVLGLQADDFLWLVLYI